ncbi:MAG: hypothetical protein M1813_003155 [Trichoglossum hirsutum]|nr:MAG: hypothetical protein M1813_003155 [Trichoglossum hirsutum]
MLLLSTFRRATTVIKRSLPGNIPAKYDPNTAPSLSPSSSQSDTADMGDKLSFIKTILIPAIISLSLYLLLTYLLLPFIRRHRQRYSQYLPLPRPTRLQDAVSSLLLPSGWAASRFRIHSPSGFRDRFMFGVAGRRSVSVDDDGISSVFDEEEGEDMVGFVIDERRREALERRRSEGLGEEEARLSRDLEEGFRDDSSSEEELEEEVEVVGSRGAFGR